MNTSGPDPSRHRARGESLAEHGPVDRPAMQPVSSRPNSDGCGAEREMVTKLETLTHDAAPGGRAWKSSVMQPSGVAQQIARRLRAPRGRET